MDRCQVSRHWYRAYKRNWSILAAWDFTFVAGFGTEVIDVSHEDGSKCESEFWRLDGVINRYVRMSIPNP